MGFGDGTSGENARYSFLLGSALRNEDTDQFLRIYDAIVPQLFSQEQVFYNFVQLSRNTPLEPILRARSLVFFFSRCIDLSAHCLIYIYLCAFIWNVTTHQSNVVFQGSVPDPYSGILSYDRCPGRCARNTQAGDNWTEWSLESVKNRRLTVCHTFSDSTACTGALGPMLFQLFSKVSMFLSPCVLGILDDPGCVLCELKLCIGPLPFQFAFD